MYLRDEDVSFSNDLFGDNLAAAKAAVLDAFVAVVVGNRFRAKLLDQWFLTFLKLRPLLKLGWTPDETRQLLAFS